MKSEQAETIALQALAWILQDDEMVTRFLGLTGADAQDLRTGAENPEVLCSVLDFVLSEDRNVLDFAQSVGVTPELVPMARYSLPGGEQVHWT